MFCWINHQPMVVSALCKHIYIYVYVYIYRLWLCLSILCLTLL
jgi:hypothetical protein